MTRQGTLFKPVAANIGWLPKLVFISADSVSENNDNKQGNNSLHGPRAADRDSSR